MMSFLMIWSQLNVGIWGGKGSENSLIYIADGDNGFRRRRRWGW